MNSLANVKSTQVFVDMIGKIPNKSSTSPMRSRSTHLKKHFTIRFDSKSSDKLNISSRRRRSSRPGSFHRFHKASRIPARVFSLIFGIILSITQHNLMALNEAKSHPEPMPESPIAFARAMRSSGEISTRCAGEFSPSCFAPSTPGEFEAPAAAACASWAGVELLGRKYFLLNELSKIFS